MSYYEYITKYLKKIIILGIIQLYNIKNNNTCFAQLFFFVSKNGQKVVKCRANITCGSEFMSKGNLSKSY